MSLCIVDLPYAYFGIEVKNGRIVDSAPIGKWMIGKTLVEIQKWALKKKGIVKLITNNLEGGL